METPEYHDNHVLIDTARRLGLDPAQITNLEVHGDGGDEVTITWEGVATLSEEEFTRILTAAQAKGQHIEMKRA